MPFQGIKGKGHRSEKECTFYTWKVYSSFTVTAITIDGKDLCYL